jgi:hypothetical protein
MVQISFCFNGFLASKAPYSKALDGVIERNESMKFRSRPLPKFLRHPTDLRILIANDFPGCDKLGQALIERACC